MPVIPMIPHCPKYDCFVSEPKSLEELAIIIGILFIVFIISRFLNL